MSSMFITARYQNGALRLRVAGARQYGVAVERTAATGVDVPDDDEDAIAIQAAMARLAGRYAGRLGRALELAMDEAVLAAIKDPDDPETLEGILSAADAQQED